MALTVILPSGLSNTGNFSVGSLVATGNLTGAYILGNGACLSGVITSVANINNGTSNVTVVSSGGNVTVGIGGTSNVAVFATTGEYITGLISASGNITGGNIITSGSGGNISGANVVAATTLSATANVVANNVIATTIVNAVSHTGTIVSVTGNITAGGGTFGAGNISTTGNIAAGYFVGNGSALTGISSTPTSVVNGTTNFTLAASGNANLTIAGTSNVVQWATTGGYVAGLWSVVGNVYGSLVYATNGFLFNNTTIASSVVFPTGYSASTVGPMTQSPGVSVTVSAGSKWVVLG